MTKIKSNYFPALTGIRAVAALLVFFNHAVLAPYTPLVTEGRSLFFKWAVYLGEQLHIGVPIFFVLSGFLITNRYFNRLELTGVWFRRYLQNRFARIYPIYFLLTFLAFAVMIVHPSHTWYEWTAAYRLVDKLVVIVLNLTLTRAFFEAIAFMGLPTAWTLTVEESFYLIAPFLLLGLKRNIKWIYLYPILLLAVGAVLVFFCTRFLPYYQLMGNIKFMLQTTFFGRCIEFIVGIGLAFWLARHTDVSPMGIRSTILGAAGIAACLVVLALISRSFTITTAFLVERFLVNNVLLPGAVAVLFWGLIKERTWLRQLLETKTFDLLGKSSYVFYLLHLGAINTLFSEYVTENWAVRLIAYTLLSIALYKWVEHPLHNRLRAKQPMAPKQAAVA